jgi:hypothetical protein
MRDSLAVTALATGILAGSALAHPTPTHEQANRQAADVRIEVEPIVNPFTHLEFRNDPDNFQFLIVSDRTGGARQGVFPDALRKAELLQPEFIMSVGDLIEGYTEDPEQIAREWDEFVGFFEGYEIPFFYVPGNHDISNPVMAEAWAERFGRSYYHFRYRDVLFLCLNTEDTGAQTISPAQVEYMRRALADHEDVRWTLVFGHKPLWTYDDGAHPGWRAIVELLGDRPYTAFAGHFHRYTKHIQSDRRHFVLATTGGGSGLGGPDVGQFDHVVHVTMTDEGPIIANLMLSGIWDEDVFTTTTARLNTQLNRVEATPALRGPKGGMLTNPALRFRNDEDVPMRVVIEGVGLRREVEVDPNTISEVPVDLPKAQGETLSLDVVTSIDPEDHRPLAVTHRVNLTTEMARTVERRDDIRVDGDLADWPALPYGVTHPEAPDRGDGTARFAVAHDGSMLYVAAAVTDGDVVSSNRGNEIWERDYIELRIDGRPFTNRQRMMRQWETQNALYIAAFALGEDGPGEVWRRNRYPDAMQVAYRRTSNGYTMEYAIPLAFVADRASRSRVEGLTLNLTVIDRAARMTGDAGERQTSWQPMWHSRDAVIGAGAFVLGE